MGSGPKLASATATLQEIIDQLRRGVIHLDVKSLDLVGEIVEHHDGRNRHEQSDGGGDQRLRDTAGDCAETGGVLRRDLAERVQNTNHGSEEADEWSGRSDGGKTTQTALQFGVNDGFRALQSTFAGFDLFARNVTGFTVGPELLQTSGDHLCEV